MAYQLPYPQDEHIARLLLLDPIATSYEWIKKYAENLTDRVNEDNEDDTYGGGKSITVDELIDTAMSHIDTGDRWGGDYITRGGTFEGESVDPTFWDKLSILLEKEIPSNKRNDFFSCSC